MASKVGRFRRITPDRRSQNDSCNTDSICPVLSLAASPPPVSAPRVYRAIASCERGWCWRSGSGRGHGEGVIEDMDGVVDVALAHDQRRADADHVRVQPAAPDDETT